MKEEMAAATDTAECKEHREGSTKAREDTSSAHPALNLGVIKQNQSLKELHLCVPPGSGCPGQPYPGVSPLVLTGGLRR